MRLAFSNIAWSRADDAAVAALMRDAGVTGVEIAPTAIWPDPMRATPDEAGELRRWWADRGIEIVALQALVYGRPELRLFAGSEPRSELLRHLTRMMELAARLGATPMVFGAPANRARGSLPPDEAWAVAVEFFARAGALAAERGVILCIEPNPPAYGCDFVTTVSEGAALVREVNSRGFGLHVDAGAFALTGEPPADAIAAARRVMCHFHASEPHLAPLGTAGADHGVCSQALRENGYDGWVSAEMRSGNGTLAVANALGVLTGYYGG